MVNFGRVVTAMATPFTEDGSVNYPVAEKLADYLIANGSDGIVVCGTTGESPTLTKEEKYELFQVIKNVVANRGKVIAGTGSYSTQEAITTTKKAAKLGIDGSLQVVPYYSKPPQVGLYEHFVAIAQACRDMPVMLYNIPGRTGKNLQTETVAKLAEVDNIVAIKEASGSLDQISDIRRSTPSSFDIYSGEDSLTLPALAVGAVGVVSVASHLVALQMQEMIQAFEVGKTNVARDIHFKLSPLFKALFLTTNPIPVKAALNLRGWDVGSCRLPLCEISPELKVKLEIVLRELSLI